MKLNRHAFREQKSRLLLACANRFSARSLEAPAGDFQPVERVQRIASGLLAALLATVLKK